MAHLTLLGAELHYELAGSGAPALVFIHGGCCSGRDWAHQVEALQGEFTVLAMDLRGHGRSGMGAGPLDIEGWAADVKAMVDALALGPAVLIGHSLGSRVAAEAAFQRPDQAAGLVLVDGSRTIGGFAAGAPTSPAEPAGGTSLAAILDRTVGPYADSTTRRHVIATMSAAPAEVMQATVRALEDWDSRRADRVFQGLDPDLPVLVIQSTYHDRFTPRHSMTSPSETTAYLDFLRRIRPSLEVSVLPETGHFSMLEKPGEVTALIRRFSVPRGRRPHSAGLGE